MSDTRDLYQEVILDHYKKPRNHAKPSGTTQEAQGKNPLCGDDVTVFLEMDGNTVKNVGFTGTGCAISTASASVMTESIKGKSREEVQKLFESFHRLLTGKNGEIPSDEDKLGKLKVFSGVREFPLRVKCASLAWHTLRAAIENKGETVTTE